MPKNQSIARKCPMCVAEGVLTVYARLNDHLRRCHGLTGADLKTQTAKARARGGKSRKSGRAYWLCPCGMAVVRRGPHLISKMHPELKRGTLEFACALDAFTKVQKTRSKTPHGEAAEAAQQFAQQPQHSDQEDSDWVGSSGSDSDSSPESSPERDRRSPEYLTREYCLSLAPNARVMLGKKN